jgi:hypothetical protein
MTDSVPLFLLVLVSAAIVYAMKLAAPRPMKRTPPEKPPESTAAKKARETIEAQGKRETAAILDDVEAKDSLSRLADRANRRRGK